MKTNNLAIAGLLLLLFFACKESTANSSSESGSEATQETMPEATIEEVVNGKFTNNEGKVLEVTFDNKKDVAIIKDNGETIELAGQKPASGMFYKNDTYELSGKGEKVTLTKAGEVLFSNEDEVLEKTVKNDSGQSMTLIFNNTQNEVMVMFNEETIEMEDLKPASGMHYKNDHYELTGKGDQFELTKDGEVIFKN